MNKHHHYKATITWTGNNGQGTSDYKAYERSHVISIEGKANIAATSDPQFRGDKTKHNPEELLVCSLSSCHMLWYLHLCATNGVVVTEYADHAQGIMEENTDGSGQFVSVTLHPVVTIKEESMMDKAMALHHDAHKMCFIARSMNFPVEHTPTVVVASVNNAR
jgi:organic hydroperoxide reductase OsmC/OhrA